jgi:hypothetical protein
VSRWHFDDDEQLEDEASREQRLKKDHDASAIGYDPDQVVYEMSRDTPENRLRAPEVWAKHDADWARLMEQVAHPGIMWRLYRRVRWLVLRK